MSNPQSISNAPAQWAPHTLTAWRTISALHDDLNDLRLGLAAALDIIRDRDKQIAQLRAQAADLRAQVRAAMTGQTIDHHRRQILVEAHEAAINRVVEERLAARRRDLQGAVA